MKRTQDEARREQGLPVHTPGKPLPRPLHEGEIDYPIEAYPGQCDECGHVYAEHWIGDRCPMGRHVTGCVGTVTRRIV